MYRIQFILGCLFTFVACQTVLSMSLSAAETVEVRHPITEQLDLAINRPADWKSEITPAPPGIPPTITFSAKSRPQFQVLITPFGREDVKLPPDKLRKTVEQMLEAAKADAVEKTVELAELKTETTQGFYFSLTDRAPKPGEFKFLTSGMVNILGTPMTFTVLTNDGQEAVVKNALAMIRSAKTVAAELRFARSTIEIPDADWVIEIESPELGEKQEGRRGKDFAMRGNSRRFNLSIFVEKPNGDEASHEECFKYYWTKQLRNPAIVKDSVVTSKHEKYRRVEYDVVVKVGGKSVAARNVNYFFAYGGRWVDVHISIMDATKEDNTIFAKFDKALDYKPAK